MVEPSAAEVFVESWRVKRIGEFMNGHGESYLVYKIPRLPDNYFVTGDELDWDVGWNYCRNCDELHKDFELTPVERAHIKHLIGE